MHHKNCMGPGQTGPRQQVVCPTRHCVQNNYFQNEVDYIHPTHTTIMNHHLTRNMHHFPQTQSVMDTFDSEDVFMPPQRPEMTGPMGMGPQVAGAETGPRPPMGMGPQVAGAQMGPTPSMGMMPQGMGPQVAGVENGNMPQGGPMGPGMCHMGKGCHHPWWRD
ncbi:CotD family spore coat protein [Halobacillus sp. MO56]